MLSEWLSWLVAPANLNANDNRTDLNGFFPSQVRAAALAPEMDSEPELTEGSATERGAASDASAEEGNGAVEVDADHESRPGAGHPSGDPSLGAAADDVVPWVQPQALGLASSPE